MDFFPTLRDLYGEHRALVRDGDFQCDDCDRELQADEAVYADLDGDERGGRVTRIRCVSCEQQAVAVRDPRR